MKARELLSQIREALLERIAGSVGRGAPAQQAFSQELQRFYVALERAVETGNPTLLDPALIEWTSSPTLTELQQKKNNVAELLDKIVSITNDVAAENLSEQDALDLLTTVTPIYVYALEKIARLEMETRVTHVSNALTHAQQKLERLDRSKSAFISIAAHELKTPLTLIEGYASMLHDTVTASDRSQIDTLLDGMNQGIRRMRDIIADLIDVSVIDNDLLSLDLQPLQLKYLLSLLGSAFQAALLERHQTLEVADFTGSETWIYADHDRLYQAFCNLVENAIKYTPDHGRISIDGRTLPGFIEVSVTDTGIGISSENQLLIFEKYSQSGPGLHSSGKSKFKGGGPGLGLSITRGIIEAHGGTIWVESAGYDETNLPGSTFHVLIPARNEPVDSGIERLFGKLIRPGSEPDGKQSTQTDSFAA